jgi:hypothetical protein
MHKKLIQAQRDSLVTSRDRKTVETKAKKAWRVAQAKEKVESEGVDEATDPKIIKEEALRMGTDGDLKPMHAKLIQAEKNRLITSKERKTVEVKAKMAQRAKRKNQPDLSTFDRR